MEDFEDLIERPERSVHRTVGRAGQAVRRHAPKVVVAAAVVSIVAALAADSASRDPLALQPRPGPTTDATSAAATSPSAVPAGRVEPLDGPGPFVVYSIADANEVHRIFAVDVGDLVGSGNASYRTMFLGELDAAYQSLNPSGQGGSALPLAVADSRGDSKTQSVLTHVYFLRRGESLPSLDPVTINAEVLDGIVRGDGKEWAALLYDQPDRDRVSLWTYAPDGKRQRRIGVISSHGTPGGNGFLHAIAWPASGAEILAVPNCLCDDPLPSTTFSISRTGRVQPATWFVFNGFTEFRTSSDGRFVAYLQARRTGCPPGAPFVEGELECHVRPYSLYVGDTEHRTVRRIATTKDLDFDSPAVSPGGRYVAYGNGRNHEIEVRSVSSGQITTTFSLESVSLDPIAWLDEDRLVVSAVTGLGDETHPPTQDLVLYTRQGPGSGDFSWSTIVHGEGVSYLGWIK